MLRPFRNEHEFIAAFIKDGIPKLRKPSTKPKKPIKAYRLLNNATGKVEEVVDFRDGKIAVGSYKNLISYQVLAKEYSFLNGNELMWSE